MTKRLTRIRDGFLAETAAADTFLQHCTTARRPNGNHRALAAAELRWATELAFLKAVVAWEMYLEYSLACYVVGQRAPSGFRVRRNIRLRASIQRALRVLRGDQEFIGWLSSTVVIERAEKWLHEGGPFRTPITGASTALGYIRVLRNAIARDSEAAQEKFFERTRKIYGSLPKRLSPGERLCGGCPGSIPSLTGSTLFEGVTALLRALTTQITP